MLPAAAGVAVFARVPLASGLLSGRYTRETTFAPSDHRSSNRHGEAFDRGETFSGVDFEVGLDAAARLAAALPDGVPLPAATLARLASRPGVTSVVPGARNVAQVRGNADAAELLDGDFDLVAFDAAVHEVYGDLLQPSPHGVTRCRSLGYRATRRTLSVSVSRAVNRSSPMAKPPWGGMPSAKAWR
jgi:aryl-alcohol dehydrogenase-like predicted oxidoreductase